MIRKLTLAIIIIVHCLNSNGQYLENKIDVGIGPSIHLPLNLNEVRRNNNFFYPSLYGNFRPSSGINAFLNFHKTNFIRLGIQVENTNYNSWNGDKDIFIITEPSLSMTSISFTGLFLQKNLQFLPSYINWGYILAPVINIQTLKGDAIPQNPNAQLPFSYNSIHAGLKTGISMMSEISKSGGLRMDVYYQFLIVPDTYYLDRSYHSLCLSFYYYFKLNKNKYFKYD